MCHATIGTLVLVTLCTMAGLLQDTKPSDGPLEDRNATFTLQMLDRELQLFARRNPPGRTPSELREWKEQFLRQLELGFSGLDFRLEARLSSISWNNGKAVFGYALPFRKNRDRLAFPIEFVLASGISVPMEEKAAEAIDRRKRIRVEGRLTYVVSTDDARREPNSLVLFSIICHRIGWAGGFVLEDYRVFVGDDLLYATPSGTEQDLAD